MKDLFTQEIMDQLSYQNDEFEDTTETDMVDKKRASWSLYRWFIGWIKGEEAVTDENWNKYLFQKEMKRLDLQDRIHAMFTIYKPAKKI